MKKDTKLALAGIAVILCLVAFAAYLCITDNPDETEKFRREANERFRGICKKAYQDYAGESLGLDELETAISETAKEVNRLKKWFEAEQEKLARKGE
jgi:hypothetical protein